MNLRRLTAAALATASVSAVLLVTASNAVATTPPYEPDPGAVGTLSFYDASGNQVTTGNINSAPMAAYVVGSVAGRAGDTSTLLNMAQPNPNSATGLWNKDTLTGSTTYPLPSTGNPANIVTLSQTHPVSKGTTGDFTVANFIAEFPNTGPTGIGCAYSIGNPSGCTNAAYENLYQLRLITANGSNQNTQYQDADILVSGTTWTQVYPTPPAPPTTTTTALSATPASTQTLGASVALKATVSPSTAVGTVQFKDGTTNIGSPVTVASGIANFSTTSLTAGSHSLSAMFTPTDATKFTMSTSSSLPYTITTPAVATTTTLGVTPPSPIVVGPASTLTATLTPSSAVGSVQFWDGTTAIGSPVAVSSGTASMSTTFVIGTHSLKATFTPTDATAFQSSMSAAQSYVVNPVPATPTTTTLGVGPTSPAAFGAFVTMTATVTPSTATGNVQFFDGTTMLVSVAASSGTASFSTSTLASGSHSLVAKFVPANPATFGASQSAATPYVISAQPTSTTLAVTPASPVVSGTTVHLTATLSPTSASGTVQFKDGSTSLGSPVAVSAGTATLSISTLSIGTHTLGADFTPTNSALFTASSAATKSLTVVKPPPASTTLAITATPASPALTTTPTITIKATVTPSAATGTVQFMDGATPTGSPVTVSGGKATYTTSGSALGLGSHALHAMFTSSDLTTYLNSTSATLTYVVNPPPTATTTALTAVPAGPTSVYSPVTLTATVTPSAATGTVQFTDNGANVGSPVAVSSGTATLKNTFTTSGSHGLAAKFTPTSPAAYTASTGTLSYSVSAAATTPNAKIFSGSTNLGGNPTLTDGKTYSVTLTGLTAGEVLDVTLHSLPMNLGTTTVGSGGTASFQFGVPLSLTGAHALVFTDSETGAVEGMVAFSAVAAPTTTPSTPASSSTSSSGPLASTGTDSRDQLLFGAMLIVLGGLIAVGARRRYRGRHA